MLKKFVKCFTEVNWFWAEPKTEPLLKRKELLGSSL